MSIHAVVAYLLCIFPEHSCVSPISLSTSGILWDVPAPPSILLHSNSPTPSSFLHSIASNYFRISLRFSIAIPSVFVHMFMNECLEEEKC